MFCKSLLQKSNLFLSANPQITNCLWQQNPHHPWDEEKNCQGTNDLESSQYHFIIHQHTQDTQEHTISQHRYLYPEHHGLSWRSSIKVGQQGFVVGHLMGTVLSTTLCYKTFTTREILLLRVPKVYGGYETTFFDSPIPVLQLQGRTSPI